MLKLDLSPSMHFFLAFSAKQLLEYAQHGNRCNGGGGILKAERRFGLFNARLWSESHFQCMPFVCSFNPPIGKFDFCASGRQLCPDKGVVLSPEESCPLLIWSNQVSSIHSLEVKQLLVLIAFAFSLSSTMRGKSSDAILQKGWQISARSVCLVAFAKSRDHDVDNPKL